MLEGKLTTQVMHPRLARLCPGLEGRRALVWRTTGQLGAERRAGEVPASEQVVRLASMCKLKAGRLSREVADACLQYLSLIPLLRCRRIERCISLWSPYHYKQSELNQLGVSSS